MNPPLTIDQLVADWDLSPDKAPIGSQPLGKRLTFTDILGVLRYADKNAFSDYIPTRAPSFFDRLLIWLQNQGVTEADQQVLFEFASHLNYFSLEDFKAMYRAAFTGPITEWVTRLIKLRLDEADPASRLELQRNYHTWYCPVTDSMPIADFYHANGLGGISHRPGFRSLQYFRAQPEALQQHIAKAKLERLVLLEDFVGTGSQATDKRKVNKGSSASAAQAPSSEEAISAVQWACIHANVPVLFVPLIVAPDGSRRLKSLMAQVPLGRLEIAPLMQLQETDFVGQATAEQHPVFARIRELAERVHGHVRGTAADNLDKSPYSPLGFHRKGDANTGATVVTYSNCPNNTLPIIHHQSRKTTWKPLFPRIEREPDSP